MLVPRPTVNYLEKNAYTVPLYLDHAISQMPMKTLLEWICKKLYTTRFVSRAAVT